MRSFAKAQDDSGFFELCNKQSFKKADWMQRHVADLSVTFCAIVATTKNVVNSCRLSSGIRFMIPRRLVRLELRCRRHDKNVVNSCRLSSGIRVFQISRLIRLELRHRRHDKKHPPTNRRVKNYIFLSNQQT